MKGFCVRGGCWSFSARFGAGSDVGRGTAPLIGSGVPFQGLRRSAKGRQSLLVATVSGIQLFRIRLPAKIDNVEPRKVIEVSEMRQCDNAGISIRFKNHPPLSHKEA
jgi:hypothetical protein